MCSKHVEAWNKTYCKTKILCIKLVKHWDKYTEKNGQQNVKFPTYIAFVDFKKAFDSVGRDKLWTIMLIKGIPTHLITIIRKIYMKNIIRVNVGNWISEDSRAITQGVRQGCPLSPVLFNLHLHEVVKDLVTETRNYQIF